MSFKGIDMWEAADPSNYGLRPREADDYEDAILIGEQATGRTIVIGREDKAEVIKTTDMTPVSLEDCR